MAIRFVRPETATLTLASGGTVTVKKRLNAGETRAMFARQYLAGINGEMKPNVFQMGLAYVTAYLLDWSAVDDQQKPVPISRLTADELTAVLDSLDHVSFTEIREAIERHHGAMWQEREEEKKTAGRSESEVTTTSAVALA